MCTTTLTQCIAHTYEAIYANTPHRFVFHHQPSAGVVGMWKCGKREEMQRWEVYAM